MSAFSASRATRPSMSTASHEPAQELALAAGVGRHVRGPGRLLGPLERRASTLERAVDGT